MQQLVIHQIGELLTLAPLAAERRLIPRDLDDLGRMRGAWLALENGRVRASGTGPIAAAYAKWPRHNAGGMLVMPGMVDAHTHPVFGGSRTHEFVRRLDGATYQEIAAQGGGIMSTVRATRQASIEELTRICADHFRDFLRLGVTTCEAKSGYGLSVPDELKLLRAIRQAASQVPLHVQATCLALHAVPPDAGGKDKFIQQMTDELLPVVAREGLATWVDAFVEKGYFEPQDCDGFFARAKELGLAVRIHADEFADSGAAEAAARWGALSADHLECASDAGIAAMAKAGTVAILLPGTSLYCRMQYTQARRFIDAGVPVAVATDFNPGSCRVRNLAFTATLAALHCGMRSYEAIAGVTYVAAHALGLAGRKGALAVGHDADVVIQPWATAEDWLADMGQRAPAAVFIGGQKV